MADFVEVVHCETCCMPVNLGEAREFLGKFFCSDECVTEWREEHPEEVLPQLEFPLSKRE